ncbi:nuclease-like protein [Cellulomonas sp. SLBN-39]|nr:nuclease-like protein [Cellulomonas sp. SLBN-39]
MLTVRRWRRYGADRLYVTLETGAALGSVDLQSGEVTVEDPLLEAGVRRAAQAYLRKDVAELVLTVEQPLGSLDTFETDPVPRTGESTGSVAARLDRLAEEGWQVLHDVPLGRQGTVVEHLLVGPGGILTVAERRHPEQSVTVSGRSMRVDGRAVAHLRDARLEASRVQGLLQAAGCAGVTVRAVLVIHAMLDRDPDAPAQDALVLSRHEVPGAFRAMPVRLEPARVSAIAQVARRRRTWAH